MQTELRYFYDNYRRYDDLEAVFKRYFPSETLWSSYYLGKRLLDEAQAANDKEMAEDPANPYALSDRGKLLALKGRFRESEALIPQILKGADRLNLTYHHRMYEVACNYGLLGKGSEAVKFLREAVATGYCPYSLFERDAYFDPIRNSPEFIRFMDEMKPIYERRRSEFK
jgi:hypothetical protein